jgi:sulfide dehydrogenase cytochrome subunit
MKTLLVSSALAMLATLFTPAHASEHNGAAMAATCAGCHGTHGKLRNQEFAALAGMPEAEFIRAMRDYKSGKRQSTLMGNLAQGFSDRDVQAMARYFARVK